MNYIISIERENAKNLEPIISSLTNKGFKIIHQFPMLCLIFISSNNKIDIESIKTINGIKEVEKEKQVKGY